MSTNAWRSTKAPPTSSPSHVTGKSSSGGCDASSNSSSPRPDVSVEERVACGKLRLNSETSRTYWNQVDVGLTFGEYKIVNLLASNVGRYVTYRAVYDCLHYEGFIAGTGEDGYRANVRSAIKRIRNKFRSCDPAFDEIKNYTSVGYCWCKQS